MFNRKQKQTQEVKDIKTGKGFRSIIFDGENIRVLYINGKDSSYQELDEHLTSGFTLFAGTGTRDRNGIGYSEQMILKKPKTDQVK